MTTYIYSFVYISLTTVITRNISKLIRNSEANIKEMCSKHYMHNDGCNDFKSSTLYSLEFSVDDVTVSRVTLMT